MKVHDLLNLKLCLFCEKPTNFTVLWSIVCQKWPKNLKIVDTQNWYPNVPKSTQITPRYFSLSTMHHLGLFPASKREKWRISFFLVMLKPTLLCFQGPKHPNNHTQTPQTYIPYERAWKVLQYRKNRDPLAHSIQKLWSSKEDKKFVTINDLDLKTLQGP